MPRGSRQQYSNVKLYRTRTTGCKTLGHAQAVGGTRNNYTTATALWREGCGGASVSNSAPGAEFDAYERVPTDVLVLNRRGKHWGTGVYHCPKARGLQWQACGKCRGRKNTEEPAKTGKLCVSCKQSIFFIIQLRHCRCWSNLQYCCYNSDGQSCGYTRGHSRA